MSKSLINFDDAITLEEPELTSHLEDDMPNRYDPAYALGTLAGYTTRTAKASIPTAKRCIRNFYDRTAAAYHNTKN